MSSTVKSTECTVMNKTSMVSALRAYDPMGKADPEVVIVKCKYY